ncbi:MAG: nucleotidyltransferase family protein [Alphaproteobacteria bacterium]|nr:nucleotidyltransferase family protein [Alphaproteobacteria bacterium]
MTRDEVIAKLKSLRPLLDSYGVTRLRLFGSHARDEADPDSDVDLLADFAKTPSLFDLGGLTADLEEALGVSVDLARPQGIKERYRERILASAIDVA